MTEFKDVVRPVGREFSFSPPVGGAPRLLDRVSSLNEILVGFGAPGAGAQGAVAWSRASRYSPQQSTGTTAAWTGSGTAPSASSGRLAPVG